MGKEGIFLIRSLIWRGRQNICSWQSKSLSFCQRSDSRFHDVEITISNVSEALVDDDCFPRRRFACIYFNLNDFQVECEALRFVVARFVWG